MCIRDSLITRKMRRTNFWVELNRIEIIRYDLESGERDRSNGDVGFRVKDPKMRFRVRAKDLKIRFCLGLRISIFNNFNEIISR